MAAHAFRIGRGLTVHCCCGLEYTRCAFQDGRYGNLARADGVRSSVPTGFYFADGRDTELRAQRLAGGNW